MFERYSESARRVIFFARYEASQFGSSTIETEHLLMGVLREDEKLLQALRTTNEELQKKIKERVTTRPKTSTGIDMPLTDECKRILAYADEEGRSWSAPTPIEPAHILLGILREEHCVAAKLLTDIGVGLVPLREHFAKTGVKSQRSASIHGLIAEVPEDRHDILRELIVWLTTVDNDELQKRIHDLLRRRN